MAGEMVTKARTVTVMIALAIEEGCDAQDIAEWMQAVYVDPPCPPGVKRLTVEFNTEHVMEAET